PPRAPDVKPEYELRGFRVPCLVVSPFARRGHVAYGVFDHTSILRLIEWRWSLPPLSIRDAQANDLASVLDFSRRRPCGAKGQSAVFYEQALSGLMREDLIAERPNVTGSGCSR